MKPRRLESRLRTWGWGGFVLIAGAYGAALLVLFLVWQRQAGAVKNDLDAYTRAEALVLARLFLYDLSSDIRVSEIHRLESLTSARNKDSSTSALPPELLFLVRNNIGWPDTELWRRYLSTGGTARLEDIAGARSRVYQEMIEERMGGVRDDLWARVTFSDNLRGVTLLSIRGAVISVGEAVPEGVFAEPAKTTRELGTGRLLVTLPLTVQANRWGTAYFLMDRAIVSRLGDGLLQTLRRSLWALAALLVLLVAAWSLWWSFLLRRVRRDVVAPIVTLARRMEGDASGEPGAPGEEGEPEWLSAAFDSLLQRLARQQEQLLSAQKLGLMERVGAGMSHELNNALNPARLRLDELAMGDRTPNREDVAALREYLSHAQQVLKDLTFAVKQPAGPMCTLPPRDWLLVARRLVEPGLHGVAELEWSALEDDPEVYGEPQWLVQVAVNLLLNAKEAIEDGALPRGRTGHIRLSLEAEAEEAVLRIQDDGPGVPSDVAEHLFEPFVTSKPRGSGLGLFMVDQLVRRMGGRIRLIPGHERGTVAEVRLRRSPP